MPLRPWHAREVSTDRIGLIALVLSMAIATPMGTVAHAQASSRHHLARSVDANWEQWAGREMAFVIERLGTADRVVGHAWHYRDVVVGNEQTGPYSRWNLTIDVRAGHVVHVTAVRTGGAGCIVVE